MATVFSKVLLSGGHANGGWLTITDTATLGEVIHTAHASAIDEVWLWATNEDASAVDLTLEWGAATEPQITSIPPKDLPVLLVPGWPIT